MAEFVSDVGRSSDLVRLRFTCPGFTEPDAENRLTAEEAARVTVSFPYQHLGEQVALLRPTSVVQARLARKSRVVLQVRPAISDGAHPTGHQPAGANIQRTPGRTGSWKVATGSRGSSPHRRPPDPIGRVRALAAQGVEDQPDGLVANSSRPSGLRSN